MNKTLRFALFACIATTATGLRADDPPARLSRDELAALLPGTAATHTAKSGSLRRWTNNADGKLVASTDNKKYGSAAGTSFASAPGTWRVSDEGRYCIQIDWKRETESWCAYILRGAGDVYYLGTPDDAHRIEFKRN